MLKLTVANTVTALIQGDISEHYSIRQIPLQGEVIGLGTTTEIDNGELCFLPEGDATTIYKGEPQTGAAIFQDPSSELIHFPYVCFTSNGAGLGISVDAASLPPVEAGLQAMVAAAIAQIDSPADYFGIRLQAHWQALVVTVAAKLCLWQRRRLLRDRQEDNVYESLKHFYFAEQSGDPLHHFLGPAPVWNLSGFYARHPETGLVTVPQANAHLHIHGCSSDLRFAGHIHHEHPNTRLRLIQGLILYPIAAVEVLKADLAVIDLRIEEDLLRFTIANQGRMDVSDADVVIVVNNSYRGHRALRLPWLAQGDREDVAYPIAGLPLQAGTNLIEVIANPDQTILEENLSDNRASITTVFTPSLMQPCSEDSLSA
ncbi:CARDB domain-containing protein [Synechococcus elongatus]|uniref:CARDB domain-containing protein n=1 Tax=Synechococcus elongatus (strain ATCC 33912 / PCC 7942 / FACHB-805) TaxID=1140 RepID=Q31N94_SYNE7|nr:CARDB domain-containing protein [Synechococcus elongatus]UOW76701.1 CARDB protein [Synechococcus elongatus PCC 6301]ABB57475.1 conserved hypothetical protein [Synechococcus elongatus PCC 7942 = FACHB-805]AJD58023.1 hypothetical protein M744_09345 [Synechococcus elongatus UTEX 2973]MBD2588491.1 hypothetical protein [Synechococcus elongatus FACHB-242]MBD2689559.1 hypothetical protein [Synechococcus elongatus FACHB-1061]